MEEWISQNEYMRRYKVGFNVLKKMIADGKLEVRTTPGGQYKIKVGGNYVSIEEYTKMTERANKAEATVEMMKRILLERV